MTTEADKSREWPKAKDVEAAKPPPADAESRLWTCGAWDRDNFVAMKTEADKPGEDPKSTYREALKSTSFKAYSEIYQRQYAEKINEVDKHGEGPKLTDAEAAQPSPADAESALPPSILRRLSEMITEAVKPSEGPKPTDADAAKPPPADAESAPKTAAARAKEAKANAKAEKAARRAAVKMARMPVPVVVPVLRDSSTAKGPQDGAQLNAQGQEKSASTRRASVAGRRPSIMALEKEKARSTIPEMFSHLSMARRISTLQASRDVHPAILAVGQQMGTFALRDGMSRLEAMLLAFRRVIESYTTPKGNSLSRHFIPHVLNHQIEYLTECRPMCFSMGNAIRIIKARVNRFDIDTPEDQAKEELLGAIDSFISGKVKLAELLISRNGAKIVATGDVILTYGHRKLVEKTLVQAHRDGKQFEVIILDDPHDPSGQTLAALLASRGMRVSYSPHLGGLERAVRRATMVMLGAEAFFANGAMYAPSGSNNVALAARDAGSKTIVLCETINFDRERVAVDAFTYNEIDPDRNSSACFRLLFDVTRPEHITGIVTEKEGETAVSPSDAILAILSKQDLRTQL